MKGHHHEYKRETWIAENWRPMAAIVYLVICLSDFMGIPIALQVQNSRLDESALVSLAVQFKESAAQIEAIKVLHEQRSWQPLTLAQNGLFHIAFGAILSVSAWTRGREKEARIRAGLPTVGGDDPNDTGGIPNLPSMPSIIMNNQAK